MKKFYTLSDLRDWREDDPPIRLGVFGYPVSHSRSPQMQNAALRASGIAMQYARFEIASSELEEAFSLVREHCFVGVNLTAPHKLSAMKFLDEVDADAAAIGAVNTVTRRGEHLVGSNTDSYGIGEAIPAEFGRALAEFDVLILGGGGAARAIAHRCVAENCRHVRIWNRTESAALALAAQVGGNVEACGDLSAAVQDAELIVNATPVGLRPGDLPFISRDRLRADQLVYDTIYEPARTKLLEEAAAAGARTANGLSMLLFQGARAFELWFDRSAPVAVMRSALEE